MCCSNFIKLKVAYERNDNKALYSSSFKSFPTHLFDHPESNDIMYCVVKY